MKSQFKFVISRFAKYSIDWQAGSWGGVFLLKADRHGGKNPVLYIGPTIGL